MKPLFSTFTTAFSLLLLLAAGQAAAETLGQAQLQDLALEFAPIEVVTQRPGRSQLMRVDTLPDDRLQLRLPFRPNRLTRLVGDGSQVDAGQPIAEVRGPELVNWLLEARLTGERYAAASERYASNRPLYEKQALSAERWQAIADRYFELQMAMHHVEHVLEWLRPDTQEESRALLVVPTGGVVLFAALPDSAEGELPIVELLDVAALRLSARLPAAQAGSAIALHSADCRLAVESRAGRASGLSRQLWSAALNGCRSAYPGQPLEGYPVFSFEGYRVPRAAVIRHGGRTLLALERGADLELQDVSVAGEDPEGFYVRSGASLAGRQVLVRSVSAVQGILLGLGSE